MSERKTREEMKEEEKTTVRRRQRQGDDNDTARLVKMREEMRWGLNDRGVMMGARLVK